MEYMNFGGGATSGNYIVANVSIGEKKSLLLVNKESGDSKYSINYLKNEAYYNSDVPERILMDGYVVYSFDCEGRCIESYNIKEDTIKTIAIDGWECKQKWDNLAGFFLKDDKLIVVGRHERRILFVDKSLSKYEFTNGLFDNDILNAYIDDSVIYAFDSDGKGVYSIRIDSWKTEYVNFREEMRRACTINGYIYGVTKENEFITIDNGDWLYHGHIEDEINELVGANKSIILLGKGIWIFQNGKLEKYCEYPNDLIAQKPESWTKFFLPFGDDEYIYFSPRVYNYMMLISKASGNISWKHVFAPSNENMLEVYKIAKPPMISEKDLQLESFLKYIGDKA